MKRMSFVVCTYNRGELLESLLPVMRAMECPIPYEVLVIDNNSTDNTREIVSREQDLEGVSVRYVMEREQGIVPARNRAIAESLEYDYMQFIDDDEIPDESLLRFAVESFLEKDADCVGGRVHVQFNNSIRPSWLEDELLPYLAEVNYGEEEFWIVDKSTPIWTANIAYNMRIFRENPDLRFDVGYSRVGDEVGGGEDAVMFKEMLNRKYKLLYQPKMLVTHKISPERLAKNYFLRLDFDKGVKRGKNMPPVEARMVMGVPLFLLREVLLGVMGVIFPLLLNKRGHLRRAMKVANKMGLIKGYYLRWKVES